MRNSEKGLLTLLSKAWRVITQVIHKGIHICRSDKERSVLNMDGVETCVEGLIVYHAQYLSQF
jgi:hypothetical protein